MNIKDFTLKHKIKINSFYLTDKYSKNGKKYFCNLDSWLQVRRENNECWLSGLCGHGNNEKEAFIDLMKDLQNKEIYFEKDKENIIKTGNIEWDISDMNILNNHQNFMQEEAKKWGCEI